MARAYQHKDPDERRPAGGGDWQDLRDELMGLLDRVDSQVTRRREPIYDDLGQHMHDLRVRIGGIEPEDRQRDALRSVQRAMDRLTPPPDDFAAPPPPLPPRTPQRIPGDRDQLRAALSRLRAEESGLKPDEAFERDRHNEISLALDGISERLDRMEAELKEPGARNAQSVREIAEQMTQLVDVVELLAGAVGETGQVKRLEAQIAALARTLEAAPSQTGILAKRVEDLSQTVLQLTQLQKRYGDRADPAPTNQRLEGMSQAISRLAELQIENVSRAEADSAKVADLMKSIEAGIRHVYDRVDGLERQMGSGHPALDRVVAELREVSAAVQAANPAGLVPMVESLGERIAELMHRVPDASGLAASLAALRDNIVAAVTPRLDSIENWLQNFDSRLPKPGEPGIPELEAQLQEMVKRLDSTGRQIAALAQLAGPPDYELVAEKVAAKTVEALSAGPRLRETDLNEIEGRLARLLDAPGRGDLLSETLSMRATLRGVNERLDRLETGAPPPPKDEMAVEPASRAPVPAYGTAGAFRRPTLETADFELPPAPQPSPDLRADALDRALRGRATPMVPAEPPETAIHTFAAEVSKNLAEPLPAPRAPGENPVLGWAFARLRERGAQSVAARARAEAAPAAAATAPPPAAVPPSADERAAATAAAAALLKANARPARFRNPRFQQRLRTALLAATIIAAAVGIAVVITSRLSAALVTGDLPAVPTSTPAAVSDTTLLTTRPLAEVPVATALTVTPPEHSTLSDPLRTGSVLAGQLLEFAKTSTPAPGNGLVPAETSVAEISPPPVADALPRTGLEALPAAIGSEALRAAAVAGDPRAAYEVAGLFSEGRVVPEDLARAAQWFRLSAEAGYAPAAYRLGSLFETGRGVARDPQQARMWYETAATAGNRLAMHNLAVLHAGGSLGAPDYIEAARWFEEAARRGVGDSQFNLAALYARGLGVKPDVKRAYHWFGLAAQRGDEEAKTTLKTLAQSLDAKTRKSLDAEIAAWKAVAIEIGANYAPVGSWDGVADGGGSISEPGVIKGVQRQLTALGYPVAALNGVTDKATAEAIRQFETALGLPITGTVNPRLLAVLATQPL